MTVDEAYKKLVSVKKCKDGSYTIKCKKGLWRVDAKSKIKARAEAMNYFIKYFYDGEYEDSKNEL